jgi:CBS domain containing-hemolysin-like protein
MDDPASNFLLMLLADGSDSVLSWSASLTNIFILVSLVAANAFFVTAEFALVAARKSRFEALAEEGNRAAQRVLAILNDLNSYISATQLGITIMSLALGWVGEPAIANLLKEGLRILATEAGFTAVIPEAVISAVAVAVAFSLITFVLIVFGELAPKMFALEMVEKVAMVVALPLQLFHKVFYYPIRLLDWSGSKAVRLFGIKSTGREGAAYTQEEILHLVKIAGETGQLKEEEQRLISQVFEFSETTVREAMVPRTEVFAIPASSSLEDIARAFRQHGYSRLPVYGESLDDIRGFVHSKDVMQYLLVKPRMFKLERVLKKPFYVVDTAKLEEVLRQMQREKFHFGFVVDEHGGVEGIITLEDLLEEIVGDISDEHDEEVNEQIREQQDGSFMLDGSLAVRDLNKRLGIQLPVSEGYTTVAGFLMSEAGSILGEGETVRFNGHTFRIEEVEKRRITRVRMAKTEPTP